jgi:hypothetical protein
MQTLIAEALMDMDVRASSFFMSSWWFMSSV